jgi:hypothetical protein
VTCDAENEKLHFDGGGPYRFVAVCLVHVLSAEQHKPELRICDGQAQFVREWRFGVRAKPVFQTVWVAAAQYNQAKHCMSKVTHHGF